VSIDITAPDRAAAMPAPTATRTLPLSAFPDVVLVKPKRFHDARGFFSETFSQRNLHALGIDETWVQDNFSLSLDKGVVRGLHLQLPPMGQAKLIRVNRGTIFDVVLDMRPNSPTFGCHGWVELSSDEWNQLYIPEGYAHGFCTLTAETEVMYKTSNYYSPEHEVGVRWDDPTLGIPWPVDAAAALLSPKDLRNLPLAEIDPINW